jgi:hypothetical protein
MDLNYVCAVYKSYILQGPPTIKRLQEHLLSIPHQAHAIVHPRPMYEVSGRKIKKIKVIYIHANRNVHSLLKESAPFNQLDASLWKFDSAISTTSAG